jgi:hypothetical protein
MRIVLIVHLFFINLFQKEDPNLFVKDSFIYEIKEDSLYRFSDSKSDFYSKELLINHDNIDLSKYHVLNFDNIYFYKKTGGLLYQLKGNEIIRIDNSYDHKLHTGSLTFFHKNQINILGGYGFFKRRDDIVYFSEEKKEWLSRNIKGDFPIEGISEINFHSIIEDNLIFCGGVTNHENDHLKTKRINKCYQVNLTTFSSKKISGNLNKNLVTSPNDYLNINRRTWLFYDNLLIIVNPVKMSAVSFDIEFTIDRIIGVIDDEIFFKERDKNSLSEIKKLNVNDFNEKLGSDYSVLYNPNSTFYTFLFGLFLSCSLFYLINQYKKRKRKIILFADKILIDKILFTKDPKWIIVVKQLLEKNTLKSHEFLDLLKNETLDIGHQNRLKNVLIDSINQRSNHLINQDLILSKKWEKDNRINIYFLNRNIFK